MALALSLTGNAVVAFLAIAGASLRGAMWARFARNYIHPYTFTAAAGRTSVRPNTGGLTHVE